MRVLEEPLPRERAPIARMEARRPRTLVFTSAGDRAALPLWLDGNPDFDLWVSYYGDEVDRYRDVATYWRARKGGKFPNLHAAWSESPEIFGRYDAVLVMDDDVVIDAAGISRLFELRRRFSLTVLQPAFLDWGKVSHPVTRFRRGRTLRYSHFVEMTCPLFERAALEAFLASYDGQLCGWGTDHWFMEVLRRRGGVRAAIVDEIPCVNPSDRAKGGTREIARLRADAERWRDWQHLQARERIALSNNRRVLATVPARALPLRLEIRRRLFRRWLQYRRFRMAFGAQPLSEAI